MTGLITALFSYYFISFLLPCFWEGFERETWEPTRFIVGGRRGFPFCICVKKGLPKEPGGTNLNHAV